ncbi:MAG TPA: hypothetical protein VGC45_10590 [Gryllotalpicola sp.]
MTSTKTDSRHRAARVLWASGWVLLTIVSAVVAYALLVLIGR